MKPYKPGVLLGLVALSSAALLGCPPIHTSSTSDPAPTPDPTLHIIIPKVNPKEVYTGQSVQKITFTNTKSTEDMTVTPVKGHSLFLIKINSSPNPVTARNTGHGYPLEGAASRAVGGFPQGTLPLTTFKESGRFVLGNQTITRYDHPGAQAFTRNPPPLEIKGPSPKESRSGSLSAPVFAAASLGDTKQFWVEDKEDKWVQIPAVLRATSIHSKVWVAEEQYSNTPYTKDNKLTQAQAQAIADKFDWIYQYETPLFGYEYGGGIPNTDPSYGGVDGDPAVHILVYDIEYDYSSSQSSGVFGFFWAKDHYKQADLDSFQSTLKTNQGELFYIDAFFADAYPEAIYSTLAHEFQHMIHFNTKSLQHKKSSETWYDEMLSLLAEDVIAPMIGVPVTNDHHPIASRIPTFLDGYNATGLTQWLSGDEVLISYANVYAFGAYLARNYGGANLIKAIMENNTTNIQSLNEALEASAQISFAQALGRYGEAFIYSSAHKGGNLSFDTTVTKRINDIAYTFTGFDLWTIPDTWQGYGPIPENHTGPLIWDGNYLFDMPGYSVIVQSLEEWQQVSADTVRIRFEKPSDPHIDLYLMIR
ncbi:MAG: hypothetical protein LBB80_05015 [Treponema sp.]|jgi:hypothetical protein|nr:hypothetical protein [Treponema sp.]